MCKVAGIDSMQSVPKKNSQFLDLNVPEITIDVKKNADPADMVEKVSD
jgi:hypothetical protein